MRVKTSSLVLVAMVLIAGACAQEAGNQPAGIPEASDGTPEAVSVSESKPADICEKEPGVFVTQLVASSALAQRDVWFHVTTEQVESMLTSAEAVPPIVEGAPPESIITDEEFLESTGFPEVWVSPTAIQAWSAQPLEGELVIGGAMNRSGGWNWTFLATSDKNGRVGFVGCWFEWLDTDIAASGRVSTLDDLIALASDPTLNRAWEEELTGNRTPVAWEDLDPAERNLDPADTPANVLDQLSIVHFEVSIPTDWSTFEEIAICTVALDWGRNECATLSSGDETKIWFSAYLPPSGSLDVFLTDASTGERIADLGSQVFESGEAFFSLTVDQAIESAEAFHSGEVLLVRDDS